MLPNLSLPLSNTDLESFGCKLTPGGTHNSRTIMLDEVSRLLEALPEDATFHDYSTAILSDNVLGKKTLATRKKTLRHVRELYGLDEGVPVFSAYRFLCNHDPLSIPLLSLLTAWSRDTLLRATTPVVINTPAGSAVKKEDLERELSNTFPDQYSSLNAAKIARNASSSWTQSGHLMGRSRKTRHIVDARPAALALALILGQAGGLDGEQLFNSPWCRLLDLNPSQARILAGQAHREGLLTMKAIGSIVEILIPCFERLTGSKP